MKIWFKLSIALIACLTFYVGTFFWRGPKIGEDTKKSSRWSHIVIHHSGTQKGTLESINVHHLQRGYDGIGYHFLIGNGVDTKDGEVQATFRYNQNLDGAHALTSDNFFNKNALGICLMGNLNLEPPTEKQMASLLLLVLRLKNDFEIPNKNILMHRDTKVTDCPGKQFPEKEFREKLDNLY